MALTLLDITKRICRSVGIYSDITSFNENNDTLDIVHFINEAYEELITQLPPETPYLKVDGTLTTVAGTRTYSPVAGFFAPNLYKWSIQNQTSNNGPVSYASLDYIKSLSPDYKTEQGEPTHLYLDGDNLALFPVPDAVYVLSYIYNETIATRLSATTDTFGVPDTWLLFVEKRAQEKYEKVKGYSTYPETQATADKFLEHVLVDAWEMNNRYLT